MADNTINDRELKLTAALYTKFRGVLEHVRSTGRLPDRIPNGGAPIAMRLLIEERGTDIELNADEQLVYAAIVREARLPAGHVVLVPHSDHATGTGGS